MTNHTTKPDSVQPAAETVPELFDSWFDPIESGVRNRVREFIETMMERLCEGCRATGCQA